jgi:hypothetical protein
MLRDHVSFETVLPGKAFAYPCRKLAPFERAPEAFGEIGSHWMFLFAMALEVLA